MKTKKGETLSIFHMLAPHLTEERVEDIVIDLYAFEKKLHRYAVIESDRELSITQRNKVNHLKRIIMDYANELKFKLEFNNDPRGYYIKFYLPNGQYNNTWDQSWRMY